MLYNTTDARSIDQLLSYNFQGVFFMLCGKLGRALIDASGVFFFVGFNQFSKVTD